MNVCLDARKLWDSGIGTYIRGLLSGAREIEADLEWRLILHPDADAVPFLDGRPAKTFTCKAPNYSLAELLQVSRCANASGADLFHEPHYVTPVGLRIPLVVTVHDLIHLQFPQYFSAPKRAYARWMLNRAGRLARRILTVSRCTRRDLVELLGIPEEKIEVTYSGVHERYFKPVDSGEVDRFLRRHSLEPGYLLYVGNLKPHKNVSGLIEAWNRLPGSARPRLVIVGEHTGEYPLLARQVNALGREREVVFTGGLPDEAMVPLYRGAAACAQPSWYEGFGSPPLEAMASGVPVAVSNRGALPEISGEAALVFDPADGEGFTATLDRLLTDSALRPSLVRMGKNRAGQFLWPEIARRTLEAYRRALNFTRQP